jgi:hypothetical protein
MHISADEANAWADRVKLNFGELDTELESGLATQVLGRVSQVYTTTGWVDASSTPSLIRKIIAMLYTGWYFERTYSEDENINNYGTMLIAKAEEIILGIISGAIILIDAPIGTDTGLSQPAFYPNDASSALTPTIDDSSLGPAKFTMGTIW